MTALLTLRSISTLATSAGANGITIAQAPGTSVGDLIVAVIGLEGVAAGSGPYVTSANSGWFRVLEQGPTGAAGSALIVWAAYFGSGANSTFGFNVSAPLAARQAAFIVNINQGLGAADENIDNIDLHRQASNAVATSNPATPVLRSYVQEALLIAGADILNAPGWGTPAATPSGAWPGANVFDNVRSGATTVRIYLNMQPTTVEGDAQGQWTATAGTGPAHGATGIIAFRPPDRRIPCVAMASTTAGVL